MAKATANVETVVSIKDVTVTLTEDEVIALLVVFNHIGGSPRDSLRKHTNAIGDAITDAVGVETINGDKFAKMNASVDKVKRSIYFEDLN